MEVVWYLDSSEIVFNYSSVETWCQWLAISQKAFPNDFSVVGLCPLSVSWHLYLKGKRCGADAGGDCIATQGSARLSSIWLRWPGSGERTVLVTIFKRTHEIVFKFSLPHGMSCACCSSGEHDPCSVTRGTEPVVVGDVTGESKLAVWRQNDHLHIKLTWKNIEINYYQQEFTKERWR